MEKWNKRFDGISSFNVSAKLGIDHKKVRKAFKNFLRQNKGTLNESVVLRPFELNKNITTTVFFPSKESLKESFSKSDLAAKHIPEFKKRLHLGHRRSELAYFSKSVLSKYFNLTDKFDIQDSLFGGFLSSKSTDVSGSSKEEPPKEKVPILRFGKRKLDKDEQVVTAILEDLAELPESEQQHWHFSEIERPNFSLFDPDFHKYYLRYYDGIPVHKRDPLKGLLEILKKINSLPNVGNLFNNLDDVHLQYPVKKSSEDFAASCDRLYKVIGPDNLNIKALKKYLRTNYNYRDKDFFGEENQPVGNEQLFGKFLKEIGFLENSIDKLLNSVKEHTIPPDHQINALRSGAHDFLSEFRNLCQSLLISYTILYEKLRK
ncbi:MAG TPA: hypothetical protein VF181_12930 [Balneolaceae bacterium]